jgi:hypothetical protein
VIQRRQEGQGRRQDRVKALPVGRSRRHSRRRG